MARIVHVLLVGLLAGAAVAQEAEVVGPSRPEAAAVAETAAGSAPTSSFSLHLDTMVFEQRSPIDPEKEALRMTEAEFRRIMWDAPMGRLRYNMAVEMSMAGRQGLVHGGRMAGVGLAPVVLGDASPGGLQLFMDGASWSELSTGERVEAGFQAAFGAAILWALIDGMN